MLGYSTLSATTILAFEQSWLKNGVLPFAIVLIILVAVFVSFFKRTVIAPFEGIDNIEDLIKKAGYKYDWKQDIFYSHMYPWQRNFGFCRLYDESAAPTGMIIDCEPFYFEYDNKRWLIELWKGQYDLCAGCEIGIYNTTGPDLNIPGVFNGTFYHCVSDEDRIRMKCTLYKRKKLYFKRNGLHWWLTGFKLGEFTEPKDLKMHVEITLKDRQMRNAFVQAMKKTGYKEKDIKIKENTVKFIFDIPKTKQPYTRTEKTDALIQKKNKFLCDSYQAITKPFKSMPEKIEAIRQQNPELFDYIVNMGKNRKLFKNNYDKIKDHIK